MADEEVVQTIKLEGVDEAEQQLDSLGAAGERAFGRISEAAKNTEGVGDAIGSIGQQTGSLEKVERAAFDFGKSLRDVGSSALDVAKSLPALGIAFIKASGIISGAMLAIAKAAADASDKLRDAAIQAGTTTEAFAKLSFAASQSGSNTTRLQQAFALINTGGRDLQDTIDNNADALQNSRERASDAAEQFRRVASEEQKLRKSFLSGEVPLTRQNELMERFRQRLSDASEASSRADKNILRLQQQQARQATTMGQGVQALQRYGISLRNADGSARDATEIFKDFADVVAKLPTVQQRAAAAAEVFGRRVGPGLVELLSQGRSGIEAFGEEAKRLGLDLSDIQESGDKFNDSLSKLTSTFSALISRIGAAFQPSFTKLFDALTESIVVLTPYVLDLAKLFADVFGPSVETITKLLGPMGTGIAGIASAIAVLVAGLGVLMKLLSPFAGLLRAAFTPFVVLAKGAIKVIVLLTRSFGALFSAIRLIGIVAGAALGGVSLPLIAIGILVGALIVLLAKLDWAKIAQTAKDAWNAIVEFIEGAAQRISDKWNAIVQFFSDAWEKIKQLATDAWNFIVEATQPFRDAISELWETIKQGASDAWDWVVDIVKRSIDKVIEFFQPVTDALNKLWELAKEVAGALGGIQGSSVGTDTGDAAAFARGGVVRGRGTSTSDSILAWLSRGEGVLTARALRHYGNSIVGMLNSLAVPKHAFGGMAETLANPIPTFGLPAFATGGVVERRAGGRPVILQFGDGEQFAMTAEGSTADRLSRYAVKRRMTSSGRKPTYYGGGR